MTLLYIYKFKTMIDQKTLKELRDFNPGNGTSETAFSFIKAELDKDFYWTFSLKFNQLPPKVAMKYKLHFYLNPQPTRDSIESTLNRLGEKQLELGVKIEEKEKEAIDYIYDLKARYIKESKEIGGIYTFPASVLEFKNKIGNKEVKFLCQFETVQKIYNLAIKTPLEFMVVGLETVIDEESEESENIDF